MIFLRSILYIWLLIGLFLVFECLTGSFIGISFKLVVMPAGFLSRIAMMLGKEHPEFGPLWEGGGKGPSILNVYGASLLYVLIPAFFLMLTYRLSARRVEQPGVESA